MADPVTFDVIERPARGIVRTMRRLGTLNDAPPAGVQAVIRAATGDFVPRVIQRPTPRRIGVVTVWEPDTDVEARWAEVVGPIAAGAGEHWHVRGEVVRTAFTAPWSGWMPQHGNGADPLADDEPALILISGELKPRWLPAFLVDAAKVIEQVEGEQGYLGGLAIQSSPMNTTSCSAWRTYADARRYAYASGAHQRAMKRDKTEEHHRTEHFVRIRPLAERGTVGGRAPFAEVLGAQPVGVTR